MACPPVGHPTAQGWTNAEMKLAQMQARVFDDELSQLSTRIRRTSRRAVWAPTVTDAEAANEELGEVFDAFNDRSAALLPSLYCLEDR